jgi:hypothetical protein
VRVLRFLDEYSLRKLQKGTYNILLCFLSAAVVPAWATCYAFDSTDIRGSLGL